MDERAARRNDTTRLARLFSARSLAFSGEGAGWIQGAPAVAAFLAPYLPRALPLPMTIGRFVDTLSGVQSTDAKTLWLTGLPAAGKSTLACELQRALRLRGRACVVLDGDQLRLGLSCDLGFSRADRKENVRRAAEVAKLCNDAGLTVIVALIAPYREDRAAARAIVGEDHYVEAYLSAGLAICEARDPKGCYARARARQLDGFTGVSAPYEVPLHADVIVDTGKLDIAACVARLLSALDRAPIARPA